ncbi:MAG: hypothetical protein ACI9MR_003919, partial [Myxococcota bacterium]
AGAVLGKEGARRGAKACLGTPRSVARA